MKNILLVLLLSFCTGICVSQVSGDVFKREHYKHRIAFPYTPLNERDVMWCKRTWRVIDMREKMNHPYYYPVEKHSNLQSLFSLIHTNIVTSELTAYDAIDDEFTVILTSSAAKTIGQTSETLYIEDQEGIGTEQELISPVESENVYRYRIKEDWFFDKQKGAMDVRIIGICPVLEVRDDNDDYKGELPMFWVYFPEFRPLLANQETVSRWNDAERRTFDDMFQKRFFSSYVYQESNVYGRKISDYTVGLDALLESQAIMKKIFDFEQDLWEY